jgi:hypothetical protein
MNVIFKTFLKRIVFIFLDDILIYKKYWEDHVQHVDTVLKISEQQMYAKPSKCSFGVKELEYLDHIVSHEGVKVDSKKMKCVIYRLLLQVCQ